MKILLTHQFFSNRSYTRQLDYLWNRELQVTQVVAKDPQTGVTYYLFPEEITFETLSTEGTQNYS